MLIDELLTDSRRRLRWPAAECDAFSAADALAEASLLDVRMDLINSDAWLLFDCRGALQIEHANVAVVIIQGVTSCRWESELREGRTWRAVMSWKSEVRPASVTVTAEFEPSGRLEVTGTTGEFFLGDVPGGDAAPPDYTTASHDEVKAGMAQWSSDLDITGASFVGLHHN
jgi:hypothetical protein